MVIKLIKRFACTCLVFTSLSVNAIPMYDIDSGGQITGVSGLTVGTEIFDATFHDGSFAALFAADPSSLYTISFASSAALSLSNFLATTTDLIIFSPTEFVGCNAQEECFMDTHTLLSTSPPARVQSVRTGVRLLAGLEVDSLTGFTKLTGLSAADTTLLTWRKAEPPTQVPAPSIALLMASGLVVFGVVRRKTRV